MVVHTLDLGETFFYQPCLIFAGASISSNLGPKHPLALNQFPSYSTEYLDDEIGGDDPDLDPMIYDSSV